MNNENIRYLRSHDVNTLKIFRTFKPSNYQVINYKLIRTVAHAVRIENVARNTRRPLLIYVQLLVNATFSTDMYFHVTPSSVWLQLGADSKTDYRTQDAAAVDDEAYNSFVLHRKSHRTFGQR